MSSGASRCRLRNATRRVRRRPRTGVCICTRTPLSGTERVLEAVELDAVATPHADQLTRSVVTLVEASVGGDAQAASAALGEIAHRVRDVEPRAGVPFATSVSVFVRDGWTCRYCAAKTIAAPVLRVLSRLHPQDFPYHPNWKAGQVHPAYLLSSTTLDHVVPGTRGGDWRDLDNLVTSCWPCNSSKADFRLDEIGWRLLPEMHSAWNGLTGHYEALWELAGKPDGAYHDRWRRALGQAEAAT
jgi:hypothetical protein